MPRKRAVAGVIILALSAIFVFMYPAPPPGRPAAEPAAVSLPDFSAAKSLLALVFVVGLLGALAWLMKKYFARSFQAGRRMQLCESLIVAPKSRILLVRIDDREFAVGVNEQAIQVLAELGRSEHPDSDEKNASTEKPHVARFKTYLKDAYKRSRLTQKAE